MCNYPLSVDINECQLGTDLCHDNASCIDTEGSYECMCETGFSGDGFTCDSQ